MTKFVGLRAKTYNYLTDDDREDEKAKGTESCAIKKTLNLKIIKTVQKQLNLRINKLSRKNKTDIDSNKENNKEIIKNSKSILKIQQRFKSERHNVFTEETNKIALSSNDDKRMQSIDSI